MAKDKIGLIFKGQGFFVGIPARNLTEKEADRYGRDFLIASGLYAEPVTKRTSIKPEKAEIEPINIDQPEADESEESHGTRD